MCRRTFVTWLRVALKESSEIGHRGVVVSRVRMQVGVLIDHREVATASVHRAHQWRSATSSRLVRSLEPMTFNVYELKRQACERSEVGEFTAPCDGVQKVICPVEVPCEKTCGERA